jgi:hypothetical protein
MHRTSFPAAPAMSDGNPLLDSGASFCQPAGRARSRGPVTEQSACIESTFTKLKLPRNPEQSSSLFKHEFSREIAMLKGGLLWLIGIPLPIILILFFLGYLS